MRSYLLSVLMAGLFVAWLPTANAQIPRTFSYQGVVMDGSGHFISDGPHNIALKLYDALGATTGIYSEDQHGVVFVKGIFNVMIGSVTPIPETIAFDRGYFLGVSVDGGAEMTPRTPLSAAPYAIHAEIADALAPGATGVVTSVNAQSGAIVLQGGGGTTVTNNGASFTISSSGGGGTGIQGVQNGDASIAVTNPNGPTATIKVADGGITAAKIAANAVGAVQIAGNAVGAAQIANGVVSPAKIDPTGSTNGQVLTSNGSAVSWQNAPGGGLALPFSGTVQNANAAFDVVNSGTGSSGVFGNNNANSGASSLWGWSSGSAGSTGVYGSNTGSGKAGYFEISNAANSAVALSSVTNGTGKAATFQITNAQSNANVVEVSTAGGGNAILGTSGTTAAAGVMGTTTSSTGDGVVGMTATAGLGTITNSGVYGSSAGGYGVSGMASTGSGIEGRITSTGIAVHGTTTSGATTGRVAVFDQISTSTSGDVLSATAIGTGKVAAIQLNNTSNSSVALDVVSNGTGSVTKSAYNGQSTSATVLELNNGYIKVSGTNKTAYVHTTTANNIVGNSTILNYPGMAATDIVFVTHAWLANRLNNGYGVWWNQANNSWEIFLENNPAGAMPVAETFNVLVIRQ